MEPWMIAAIALVVGALVLIPLIRRSNRAANENHKRCQEKWQELYQALSKAHVDLAKHQSDKPFVYETRIKVFELLIEAAQHLSPDHSWVSTRRIITSGDYYDRCVKGLELVSQARAAAGI